MKLLINYIGPKDEESAKAFIKRAIKTQMRLEDDFRGYERIEVNSFPQESENL